MRIRPSTPLARAIAAAALALLALPAAASAQVQVTIGGYDVPSGPDPSGALIVSGTSADDEATVTFVRNAPADTSDDLVRVTSTTSAVSDNGGPGGACDPDPEVADAVLCLVASIPDGTWVVVGGSGDDSLTIAGDATPASITVWVLGGYGDDELVGGAGAQRFYGEGPALDSGECGATETCDDTISDGLGRDRIFGEGGDDSVLQSPLAGAAPDADEDDINLSDGDLDTVSYAARAAADAVTIRIGATDGWDDSIGEPLDASGTPGEEDDIQSGAERVVGTPGADTFRTPSSPFALQLDGAGGDDVFWAGPAAETFVGGAGVDTVRWDEPTWDFGAAGVTGTANGVADDGDDPGNAPDDVRGDIERIVGTYGPDVLRGATAPGCRLAGGAGADSLTAGSTGCVLEGGDGVDVLAGGAGDDVLRPGASSTVAPDELTFGGGSDAVDYASATIVAGVSAISGVQASANAGAAAWCYGLGVGVTSAYKFVAGQPHRDRWHDAPERIVATSGGDTLCGGTSGSALEGGAGADVLAGGPGPDVLRGGDGNDQLNGQGGDDVLDGGAGVDTLNGGAGSDVVDGGDGDDPHVRGGGGSDVIRGGAGDDVLDEVAFSTIVQGQPGDELDAGDVLDGGPGADRVDGNAGDDAMVCSADTIGDAWTDSGGGTETLDCSAHGAPIAYAAGAGIDRVVGTAFGDVLSGGAVLDGGAGDDALSGAAKQDGGPGNDALTGTGAADELVGGAGNDVLLGGAGDDVLDGGGGGDVIRGGAGSETISYQGRGSGVRVTLGSGADDGQQGEGDDIGDDVEVVIGTAFADTLQAGGAAVDLRGGAGDDVLVGSPKGDALDGGLGSDRLASGAGADVLHGGDGNDTLLGGNDGDQLWGDAGNDVMDGGAGRDLFAGGAGIDSADYRARSKPVTVTLGAGSWNDGERKEGDHVGKDVENVLGGRGNDVLVGSAAANLLRGGAGNDRLTGGAGIDRFYGDAGNDVIDARDSKRKDRAAKELVDGGAGRDRARADARDRLVRIELRG